MSRFLLAATVLVDTDSLDGGSILALHCCATQWRDALPIAPWVSLDAVAERAVTEAGYRGLLSREAALGRSVVQYCAALMRGALRSAADLQAAADAAAAAPPAAAPAARRVRTAAELSALVRAVRCGCQCVANLCCDDESVGQYLEAGACALLRDAAVLAVAADAPALASAALEAVCNFCSPNMCADANGGGFVGAITMERVRADLVTARAEVACVAAMRAWPADLSVARAGCLAVAGLGSMPNETVGEGNVNYRSAAALGSAGACEVVAAALLVPGGAAAAVAAVSTLAWDPRCRARLGEAGAAAGVVRALEAANDARDATRWQAPAGDDCERTGQCCAAVSNLSVDPCGDNAELLGLAGACEAVVQAIHEVPRELPGSSSSVYEVGVNAIMGLSEVPDNRRKLCLAMDARAAAAARFPPSRRGTLTWLRQQMQLLGWPAGEGG